MRCATCGVNVSLPNHVVLEIDTLKKEYLCHNGHKTIVRRYGHTVEINGEKRQVSECFDLANALRLQESKKRNILKVNALRTKKNRY